MIAKNPRPAGKGAMKTLVGCLLVLLAFSAAARAEQETERRPILGGIASVDLPADWRTLDRDFYCFFLPVNGDETMLLVNSPSPNIDVDRLEEYAAAFVADMHRDIAGNFVIRDVQKTEADGGDAVAVVFAVERENDESALGLAYAVKSGDWTTFMMATGTMGTFEKYQAVATGIMKSCRVDPDEAEANREQLGARAKAREKLLGNAFAN